MSKNEKNIWRKLLSIFPGVCGLVSWNCSLDFPTSARLHWLTLLDASSVMNYWKGRQFWRTLANGFTGQKKRKTSWIFQERLSDLQSSNVSRRKYSILLIRVGYFWTVGVIIGYILQDIKEEVFPGLGITKNRWHLLSYSLKLSFSPEKSWLQIG